MKGKRLKRYKIKTTYSEPNFAYQAKIILLLLFVFQFNTIIQSHNKHEMLFHSHYKTLQICLTRVDLRDYFYAEICLRPNYFKFVSPRYMILMLLLISGNIHPNPGPRSIRHTCPLCSKNASVKERIICCSASDSWYHVACLNISSPQGEPNGNSAVWICNHCSSCNFSSNLLLSRITNFNSTNSFSTLEVAPEKQHISSLDSKRDDNHHPKRHNEALKVLTVNVNHILAKRVELLHFLVDNSIDIMIACETKIDENICDAELGLENFDIYRKDRNIHGGGVLVAVKKQLKSRKLEITGTECELVCVKLMVENTRPVVICAFYRPPSSTLEVMENLKDALMQVLAYRNVTLLLSGDFNLPDIDWEANALKDNPLHQRESRSFLETVSELGLKQFVKFPTRGENMLDLILSNKEFSVSDVRSCPGVSDHEMIIYNFHVKAEKIINRTRKVYLYHKADLIGLRNFLQNAYIYFKVHVSSMDVESQWVYFKNKLFEAVDKFVPSKVLKPKSGLPWVNSRIRREIRRRERLYKKAKRTGSLFDSQAFKHQKRRVKYLINTSHNEYVNNYILNDDGLKTKRFWKYVKSKRSYKSSIKCLIKNNLTFTNSKDILNALNDTFFEAFSRDEHAETVSLDSGDCSHASNTPHMPNIEVTFNGIKKLIEGLDSKKSPGPDNISPGILKLIPNEAASFLEVIYKNSLATSEIPDDWKMANITPLHKKGAKSNPSNYRLVSLTSIPCKLLEHIIKSSMYSHLEKYNLITSKQHGFRKHFSCTTQLLSLVHDLCQAINAKGQTDIIFLDFSKAFDKVSHRKLLQKLSSYGFGGLCHSWLRSFLSSRTQAVVMDGERSFPCEVLSGVPQGTVLGPILFLIYINDIVNGLKSNINLFADDCALYRKIESEEDNRVLQDDLNLLHSWGIRWSMDFNVSKCFSMTVTLNRNIIHSTYHINGVPVENLDSYKYLGVYISSKMQWNKTVDHMIGKANKTLGLLKRNFSSCSSHIKEKLYLSLVRPHLEYSCEVWSPSTKDLKHRLEMVQRHAARFVKNDYQQTASVTAMLKELNWDTLESRRTRFQLKYVHKMLSNQVALNPFDYFEKNTYSSLRNSHSKKLTLKFARVDVVKNSFFYSIVPLWNSLPPNVTEQANSDVFFDLCKTYISAN